MIPPIFESEYRFCLILWRHEPIKSAEIAKICKQELGWSRTTTYTVIKRLSDRGIVKNEQSIVTSLISKEEVQFSEMDSLLEKTFENSIPAFLAAFAKRQTLSEEEIQEIRHILDNLP